MSEARTAADTGAAAPSPAPNGQDTSAPPSTQGAAPAEKSYTVTDTRSAGDAIAGLLYSDEKEGPPERPQRDTGADEAPEPGAEAPTGKDEDGKSEQQPDKAAAIEAPASWNSEDKAAFGQLPPALQATVARRESQREAALTQRSQEAAEARRAWEGERQAAVTLRAEYLSGLQKMLVMAAPEAQALTNVDWVQVQAQSPAEYTRLHALREQLRSRLGAIEAEFQTGQQQLAQQQAYQQTAQLNDLVNREHLALNEKMPDFADETKGGALRRDLSNYLRDEGGFSPDEISKAYDHRLVVLATKAMLYDKQVSNSAAADAKRNNAPPRVREPGNSQDNDRSEQGSFARKVNRLGRTNSVRDAGSLIADIL
jgi:hypothetical protein